MVHVLFWTVLVAVQPVKPEQCKDFPSRWVNSLWGKVPIETMRREYPMLFACAAFTAFLKTNNLVEPGIVSPSAGRELTTS